MTRLRAWSLIELGVVMHWTGCSLRGALAEAGRPAPNEMKGPRLSRLEMDLPDKAGTS